MSRWRWIVAVLILIAGCGTGGSPSASTSPTGHGVLTAAPAATPLAEVRDPTPSPLLREAELTDGLSAEEAATLGSLERVDAYPLYTMHYYGSYESPEAFLRPSLGVAQTESLAWACSLFAALGDAESLNYGRNFDWEFSPALLLFTNPPDGYASVSMVNTGFFGLRPDEAEALLDMPLSERRVLLHAPLLPIDGMNEHGLAIGMAAVGPGNMQHDPSKETIGSLGIIRQMLDHARDVDEAVAILGRYNIDFSGGPPIHYLLADRRGRSVLVEFYQGEMVIFPNEAPWHLATNFLLASVGAATRERCWRYDRLNERLIETVGQLGVDESMELLAQVAQPATQWSIVYEMSSGDILVVMDRKYDRSHLFHLRIREAQP